MLYERIIELFMNAIYDAYGRQKWILMYATSTVYVFSSAVIRENE